MDAARAQRVHKQTQVEKMKAELAATPMYDDGGGEGEEQDEEDEEGEEGEEEEGEEEEGEEEGEEPVPMDGVEEAGEEEAYAPPPMRLHGPRGHNAASPKSVITQSRRTGPMFSGISCRPCKN